MSKKKRRKIKRLSGHSDVNYKQLGKRQLKELKEKGHTYITIRGQKKRVTWGNVIIRSGKYCVGYYERSDTGRIALRNYARDRSIKAKTVKKYSARRGMEGDRKGSRV